MFAPLKSKKKIVLRGSLRDFGPTDLLQLLGQQRKTGTLELEGERKIIQVIWEKGKIMGAAFPGRTGEGNPLGERLIRLGLLDREKWRRAGQQRKEEFCSWERVLADSGMVGRETLREVFRLMALETIYDLFHWKGGKFRFLAGEVALETHLLEPLDPEYLLLDILRMMDEWPLIFERLPAWETVLRRKNGSRSLEELGGGEARVAERLAYSLVDGRRTVRQIAGRSLAGEFETCKGLVHLLEGGMVEAVPLWTEPRKWGSGISSLPLREAASWGLAGLVVLVLLWQLIAVRWSDFPFSPGEREGWSIIQGELRRVEEKERREADEVRRLEREGAAPPAGKRASGGNKR
ncbi:MAG: DUF4388 domain-containing protein [Deltaproteobacteria bacterium]|nr:DUF4388 domain-containing protein [Deltaproteobacteria bacterium]